MRDARFVFSLLTALVSSLAWVACSSVPDLQFVDDARLDGGSDGSTGSSGDAAAAKDGAVVTPPVTGVPCVDAGAPANAVCCGAVICRGCAETDCATCASDCKGSAVCCLSGPKMKCGGSQGCQ